MTMLIVMTSQSDILPRAESDKNLKTSQNKQGPKILFELGNPWIHDHDSWAMMVGFQSFNKKLKLKRFESKP